MGVPIRFESNIEISNKTFNAQVFWGYGKFLLRLIESAMFGATFNLVTRVGVP